MIAWLGGLVANFAAFFGARIAERYALSLTILAVFVSLTAALWGGLYVAAQAIVVTTPPAVAMMFGALVPSNFPVCAGALWSARLTLAAYQFHVSTLNIMGRAV